MGVFDELSREFPLEAVEPYGQVLVVPSKAFRQEWQARLESEGVKVYSGAHGSQVCFFLKAAADNIEAMQVAQAAEEAPQPPSQVKVSRFQPTWTREEEETLLKLYGEGVNFVEIGKRLGKSKDACYAKWKRLAESSKKQPKPETQGETDAVQEFINALNMLYPKHKRICLFLIKHASEVVSSDS